MTVRRWSCFGGARWWSRALAPTAVACVALAAPAPARAQESQSQTPGAEVVRGQIVDSGGAPVAGAGVVVTGLKSLLNRAARTDAHGRYTVLFADAEGEYLVIVRALGYRPQGVRIRRAPESNSPFLLANVVLAPTVVALDTIAVRVPGATPDGRSIGGAETDVTRGALFSLDPSDIEAMAARAPGVTLLGGAWGKRGFSVLGGSPDQNRTTLDGSTIVSPQLPPDAIAKVTLSQTTYDPSQGGFAGGQLSVQTRGGNDFLTGTAHAEAADARLAWADPAEPTRLGRDLRWGGGASGPLRRGRAYFNFAVSGVSSTTPGISLLSLNATQRNRYGLSLDSIDAVRGALQSLGVPSVLPGGASGSSTTGEQGFLRLDVLPSNLTSLHLDVLGDWQHRRGGGIGPMSFPSLGARGGGRSSAVLLAATSFTRGLLTEIHGTVQHRTARDRPMLAFPHGVVRLGTVFTDGQTGITQLDFGGSSSGANDSRMWMYGVTDKMTWTSRSGRQRLSFGGSLEVTQNASSDNQDPFGTYSYQSFDDLVANRPAGYVRTISSRALASRSVATGLFAGAASDRRNNALRLEYGVRVDFARVGSVPAYNATAQQAFGIRTDRVPRAVGVTPRLGFNWQVAAPKPGEFDGRGVSVAGGIGGFRGVIPASRVAGLANQTGLPDAVRRLACAGDATPIPRWEDYAASQGAVPTECLDGTAPAEFSSSAPAIGVFDRSYQPPTAWRGNLALNGLRARGWTFGFGGAYSIGAHEESSVDLNMRRTPVFALGAEGDRPVYVPTDAIVPSTGAVAPAASRVDDRFASVMSFRSDMRLATGELTATADRRARHEHGFGIEARYTFQFGRARRRSFDQGASTAGDPFAVEWLSLQAPAHRLLISASRDFRRLKFLSFGVTATVTSGERYTPLVGGDVNGDGRVNDRAFIVDPAAAADTSMARQMSELLAAATPDTRACLLRQRGRIAAANSCSTGWRVKPDFGLNLTLPWEKWSHLSRGVLDDHFTLAVRTSNATGALFRLLHLERSTLGRLTATNYPTDPVLAYVTGFDPSRREFRYRLNQQFGEGRPQRVRSSRYAGTFQVTLAAGLQFGGPPKVPLVEQLGLLPTGRDAPRPTREQMRERARKLAASPYATMLRLRDSLLLNERQIAELTRLDSAFMLTIDSLLAPLADYVAEHGRDSKDREVQKRIDKALEGTLTLFEATLGSISALLTDQQVERLPDFLKPQILRVRGEGKRER